MSITVNGKPVTVSSLPISAEDLLRENGISLSMPCGGRHTCGKCRIRIRGQVSPMSEQERRLLSGASKDERLACVAQITGDCEIFLEDKAPEIVSDGVLSLIHADPIGRQYGFAVDIGTTTVAVYLYDLKSATELGRTAFPNPQSVFGGDVISRIEASLKNNGAELQRLIGAKLAASFRELCRTYSLSCEQIDAAVITGNTTMLYLLLGADVTCLSAAPFTITDMLGRSVPAADCGIDGFPGLSVYLPRTISSFVGSDITCSALSAIGSQNTPDSSLLIDIGTNGEMAITDGDRLICCSTAAGPAFEGAGITMGSMAVSGAISSVRSEGDRIVYSTVGSQPATGLCGSGLIDAVATFVTCGLIDDTGCIDDGNEAYGRYLCTYEDQPALRIGDSAVVLTQKDIRAVQLAKAAIRAGIESLLDACKVTTDKLDRLILAGGFGSYINVENAGVIGLIPAALAPKAQAVGNAAGMGACAILLSKQVRDDSTVLAQRADTLDLSTSPFFMDSYVENMMFVL